MKNLVSISQLLPYSNIKAGTKYITWLHAIFEPKIANENERMKFILAAYNAGPGHVLDAMRLAEKNGMDPQKWDEKCCSMASQEITTPLLQRHPGEERVFQGY